MSVNNFYFTRKESLECMCIKCIVHHWFFFVFFCSDQSPKILKFNYFFTLKSFSDCSSWLCSFSSQAGLPFGTPYWQSTHCSFFLVFIPGYQNWPVECRHQLKNLSVWTDLFTQYKQLVVTSLWKRIQNYNLSNKKQNGHALMA